ncbi:mucin-3A isoform X2 [Anoplophora glabripennis]|nr:mucin-3A isoform X2 [Anoplophora glabripennis]
MYKRQLSGFVIFWTLLTALHRNVEANPTKRLSRMVREVYPEIEPENEGNQAQVCIVGDLVYGAEEAVPAEQPCLKCRCQPPGVQCETIQCVKKPGCKAIHKPNKCCPDYQCECEHNGKFYANGEKLETPPGGECKVCYCRGGEVQCAEVSCYIRKDCEGKRVPGKCCPKYDHCPPIDPLPGRSPYTTEINPSNVDKESFEPWSATKVSLNTTEEILSPTSLDIQDENKIPDTNYYEATTPSFKLTEVEDLQKESFLPKITIQEIIPERKEIPITAPPKVEPEPQGTLIIEEAEEFLNHSNDLVVTDVDTDSSEISEVFQHPPPILRIGDKLLFLKKGELVPEKDTSTPSSVITIIGAEGLQRGGFEDSGEVHEVNIPKESEDTDLTTNATLVEKVEVLSESNGFLGNPDQSLDSNASASEVNTAAPYPILPLFTTKNSPSTTTTETSTTEFEVASSTTETNVPQDGSLPSSSQEISNDTNGTPDSTDLPETTVEALDTLTTEEIKNITEATPAAEVDHASEAKESAPSSTKTYDIIPEQNPAYPPIPDIMTINTDDTSQRFDMDHTEKEFPAYEPSTISPNFKILPEILEIRSNKTVPTNMTHGEWLKLNPQTLINYEATLPDDLLNQPAPTDADDSTEASKDTNITVPETTTETLTTTEATEASTTVTEVVTNYNKKSETIAMPTTNTPDKEEESARSTESLEESSEEKRESTTKKNSHASITTNEDASIENEKEDSSEAKDMSSTRDTVNNSSGEETTPSVLTDPSMIDKEFSDPNQNKTNTDDVEFVDAVKTKKPVIERNIEFAETVNTNKPVRIRNADPAEPLPKPEKLILPSKIITKRENDPEEGLDVLKQLSKDISAEVTERNLSSEEEERESQEIFKQLLEDTSTSKPKKELNSDEVESVLQRITGTFAQHALRGQNPGQAILRFLRNQDSRK